MPLTTTTDWPALTDGKKAKASEVETKFDWLEGTLYPMKDGEFTTAAYDVGSATYRWRNGYFQTVVIGGSTLGASAVNAPSTWLSLYNSGAGYAIGSSYNVASVVETSAGAFTISFTTPYNASYMYAAVGASDEHMLVVDKSIASINIENRDFTSGALATIQRLGLIITGTQ